MPAGADLTTFLLSDGRLEQRPTFKADEFRTLGELLDEFLKSLTPGALEPTTEHCVRIHVRHLKRVLGEHQTLRAIDFAAVQGYVDHRALAKGLNGKTLSATTIKKEIATLNMTWSWAQNHEYIDRPLPKKGLRYPKTTEKPPFQTIADIERKIALGLPDEEAAQLWDAAFLTLPEIAELLRFTRLRSASSGVRWQRLRHEEISDLLSQNTCWHWSSLAVIQRRLIGGRI